MRRFKYQAMVKLRPAGDGSAPAALPADTCRMVIKARHRETGATKIFSSLVTNEGGAAGGSGISVVMLVLGDDAGDYLAPGERFALWRGHEMGSGIVTRRVFV